jgi:hypothetical protein
MKMYARMDVQLHVFLISALDGGKESPLHAPVYVGE